MTEKQIDELVAKAFSDAVPGIADSVQSALSELKQSGADQESVLAALCVESVKASTEVLHNALKAVLLSEN